MTRCYYAIHPPECPGDTPKCSAEHNIEAVLRARSLIQDRSNQDARVAHERITMYQNALSASERRVQRLTRALRTALQIRARAFRAGFNECLELVEAGVVPEKMPAPTADEE